MSNHVEMDELAAAMGDEEEYEQGLEGHGPDREEVCCPDKR
jgi:hypothetical protein